MRTNMSTRRLGHSRLCRLKITARTTLAVLHILWIREDIGVRTERKAGVEDVHSIGTLPEYSIEHGSVNAGLSSHCIVPKDISAGLTRGNFLLHGQAWHASVAFPNRLEIQLLQSKTPSRSSLCNAT